MGIFRKKVDTIESDEARENRLDLIENLTFEVVPMKSLAGAVDALPEGAEVSVTCSPVKGIEETQRVTVDLAKRGFRPIPHISARMVRDQAHAAELASWFRSEGLSRIFVVGGDATESGLYPDVESFLGDLLGLDHGLSTIGVTAYPDGHAFVSPQLMHQALHNKQQLLDEAGVDAYCSTQMCFDPITIAKWIRSEREQGLTMPIHLGLPGVVDKAKLMTMGVRLGIGASLSYLKKNKAAVTRMLASTSYDPNDLLVALSDDMLDFGVQGLHVFTFNQVEATNAWRENSILRGEVGGAR